MTGKRANATAQQVEPQPVNAVSCWMDIVAGTDPNSRPNDSFLRVGQEATLVVRVRQIGTHYLLEKSHLELNGPTIRTLFYAGGSCESNS